MEDGITPAWAGKSNELIDRYKRTGDYHRVGGEESLLPRRLSRRLGLPPRGRGRGDWLCGAAKSLRITPAWAGKRMG